jgi:hypothetical protein
MRLEDANVRGDYVYLDFARPRTGHGPGHMAKSRPIQDFDLPDDEAFGEDTAVAFDPASGYAAVQYNHYGPRVSAIEQYLSVADRALGRDQLQWGYEFGAYLKPDAYRRLRGFGLVHEVDFTVALPAVGDAEFAQGESVQGFLRAPLPQGVETMSVQLKAGRGRDSALGRRGVLGIAEDLMRLGPALKSGSVRGRRDDGQPDWVDLVKDQLVTERDVRAGRGQRFARPERWMALRDALGAWLATGQLPV